MAWPASKRPRMSEEEQQTRYGRWRYTRVHNYRESGDAKQMAQIDAMRKTLWDDFTSLFCSVG